MGTADDAHLDTLLSRFCAENSDARKVMFHRSAMLFAPLVFLALCGVSAGQEDMSALIRELNDKDKEVRRKAAYSLALIGPDAKKGRPGTDHRLERRGRAGAA